MLPIIFANSFVIFIFFPYFLKYQTFLIKNSLLMIYFYSMILITLIAIILSPFLMFFWFFLPCFLSVLAFFIKQIWFNLVSFAIASAMRSFELLDQFFYSRTLGLFNIIKQLIKIKMTFTFRNTVFRDKSRILILNYWFRWNSKTRSK